jgi:hypothetical protein
MKEKTLPVIEFFSREVLRRGEDLPRGHRSIAGLASLWIPPRDIR